MEYTINVLDTAPTGQIADVLRHVKFGSVLAGLLRATTKVLAVTDNTADLGCVAGIQSIMRTGEGGLDAVYLIGQEAEAPDEESGEPGFCTLATVDGRTTLTFAEDDTVESVTVQANFLPDEVANVFLPWPPV